MDLTDENDYEKKLQRYKTAELMVEEFDVEISYLNAKLEGLNKTFFHINKSIENYEIKYEVATMQSMEISWKQKKANVLLSTIRQYEAKLQETKKEVPLESNKLENLKKEIELLEINCSENTEIIKRLSEELSKQTDENAKRKFKI